MSETHQPPPDALLIQSLIGFMVSKSLSAVAELGVADKLQDRPLSGRELARAVHADERFLCRVMRLLLSKGIFAEPAPGTYALTPCRSYFSRFRNIVDIGGGRGFLLRAVLAKAPNARGTLFDLPGVFEGDGIDIARAMDSAGTVILVEMVMPQGQEPHFAKFADINMLAFTEGGCERTEQEFATLFESAGLQLKSIRGTPTVVGVVEAVKRR